MEITNGPAHGMVARRCRWVAGRRSGPPRAAPPAGPTGGRRRTAQIREVKATSTWYGAGLPVLSKQITSTGASTAYDHGWVRLQ